ncbi:MAG: Hsp70 family protein [Myxococcales bacterium]|nr:Hsp70 family protein [Myxococcales bacterium]
MRTIGIDLGTTNTVAATRGDVLPLKDTIGGILPSIVAFPPNGTTLFGHPARLRRGMDPKNTIYSAKRLMGELPTSYAAQQVAQNYPFDLGVHEDGTVAFQTRAGTFSAQEIATLIVQHYCATTNLTPEEMDAVVTVPAAFGPAQRTATRRALRNAGMPEVRMVDEPIATAIAYLQRSNLRYGAVYDFGGGTFDFAILDCSNHPFRVIAHGGDPYLGGDDIDRGIAHWAADRVMRAYGWDLGSDSQIFERLVVASESAKIALSQTNDAVIDIAEVDPAAPTQLASLRIDRQRAWDITAGTIQRTFHVCDEVLREAGLRVDDLQAVFMAGGSTAFPGLAEHVQRYFGKRPRTDIPPMAAVAIGASFAAARPGLSEFLGEEHTNV